GGSGGAAGSGGMTGSGGSAGSGGMAGGGGSGISFALDIQPYFEPELADCVGCHSGGGPAGVDLDGYANILAGGDSGPLLVPGNSNAPQATLIPQLLANHRNGPDDAAFVDILSLWIDDGAPNN
ncbi:MAG: c-type cytochrome domain-containing protein, partial [Polyangiales bacterium]